MDPSLDEVDSRIEAVGRKRFPSTAAYDPLQTDKRLKTYHEWETDSISKGSGQISIPTEASHGAHQDSGETNLSPKDEDVTDLAPGISSYYGFTPINPGTRLQPIDLDDDESTEDFDGTSKQAVPSLSNMYTDGDGVSGDTRALTLPTDASLCAVPGELGDLPGNEKKRRKPRWRQSGAHETAMRVLPLTTAGIDFQKSIAEHRVVLLTIDTSFAIDMAGLRTAFCKTLLLRSGRNLAFALSPLWRDPTDPSKVYLKNKSTPFACAVFVYTTPESAWQAAQKLKFEFRTFRFVRACKVPSIELLVPGSASIPDFNPWSSIPAEDINEMWMWYTHARMDEKKSKAAEEPVLKQPHVDQQFNDGERLGQEEWQRLSQRLQDENYGIAMDDIQHAGLKGRVKTLLLQKENTPIAQLMYKIAEGGDYHGRARRFLKEAYQKMKKERRSSGQQHDDHEEYSSRKDISGVSPISDDPDEARPVLGSESRPMISTTSDTSLLNMSREMTLDIIKDKQVRNRVRKVAAQLPGMTIEMALRSMNCRAQCHQKQAKQILHDWYETHPIRLRPGAEFDGDASKLSLKQLRVIFAKKHAFFRPLSPSDVPDKKIQRKTFGTWRPDFSNANEQALLTLATLAEDKNFEAKARAYLNEYVNANYIGEPGEREGTNKKAEGRDGGRQRASTRLRKTLQVSQPSAAVFFDGLLSKTIENGAASLTLAELGWIFCNPSNFSRPMDQTDVSEVKEPNDLNERTKGHTTSALAPTLLYMITIDDRAVEARACLNQYIDNYLLRPDGIQANSDSHAAEGTLTPSSIEGEATTAIEGDIEDLASVCEGVEVLHDEEPVHSKAERLGLDKVKKMLSDPTKFTRRMDESDMSSKTEIKSLLLDLRDEMKMSLEQAVLYLLEVKAYQIATRNMVNRYIENCYRGGSETDILKGEVTMDDSDGGYPHTNCNASGEVVRSATAAHSPASAQSTEGIVRLFELSDEDQELQRRYFHLIDPESFVRCLCCGEKGHGQGDCPELRCVHCGAFDQHFSGACPANIKCGRCRQRGHETTQCTAISSTIQGFNDFCDVCGGQGHVEEECACLWKRTSSNDEHVVKVPRSEMIVACYNCGASGALGHWGDDCPQLPHYVCHLTGLNPVWSAEHANKFIQHEDAIPVEDHGGYVAPQNYQLAMLDDMRD